MPAKACIAPRCPRGMTTVRQSRFLIETAPCGIVKHYLVQDKPAEMPAWAVAPSDARLSAQVPNFRSMFGSIARAAA